MSTLTRPHIQRTRGLPENCWERTKNPRLWEMGKKLKKWRMDRTQLHSHTQATTEGELILWKPNLSILARSWADMHRLMYQRLQQPWLWTPCTRPGKMWDHSLLLQKESLDDNTMYSPHARFCS